MTHNPETVERVAKAAAFSIRQPNDVSADEDEYWQHTAESARHTWIVAITAALSALPPQEVSPSPKVRKLVWLGGGDIHHTECGQFRIEKLDSPRRTIWRLLQADFGTTYRGDFGGKDGLEKAKEVAQTIEDRRILGALE